MRNKLNWLLAAIFTIVSLVSLTPVPAFAQYTTIQAPVYPKYIVLGVVYAPPGSSSSVTYGNSLAVGSTDSVTQGASATSTIVNTESVGGNLFGFGVKSTTTQTDGWTTASSSTAGITVQTTSGNSISTLGPISSSLGVNHDNDVIYILLNPMLTNNVTYNGTTINAFQWTNLYSNSCDLSDSNDGPSIYMQISGCDPNQYPYPDIVGIPVWCLKNPYYPGQGCAQWLPYTSRSWDISYRGAAGSTPWPVTPANPAGLTLQDYADILRADPFVQLNGNSINACHATYGVNVNPNDPEIVHTPVPNGTVGYVAVTYSGSYTGIPAVSFTTPIGNTGSGATGSAIMSNGTSGTVVGVAITSGGSNYSAAPAVSFTGGGQASAATAVSYISVIPNTCGPSAVGTQVNRFQPYGTVEYPVPGPNGLPSTYAGTFSYTNTNTNETTASDSHTTGYSVDTTAGFNSQNSPLNSYLGPFSFSAEFSNAVGNSSTMTWQNSNSSSKSSVYSATYSITGPQLSDNYTGPATYNVYLDNIYGTYAFYSDFEPKINLGAIGVSMNGAPQGAVLPFAGTAVGNSSTPYQITLTNNATTPMTMVWPAVTFTDAGFQLIQNNTSYPDNCSNQYLLPYGQNSGLQSYTCTLYIEFSPQASDAPNPYTKANQVVQATMIAAGTQNATSYQNILVVSETPVYGIVTGATSGATLLANQGSVTTTNGIPNIYPFAATSFGSNGIPVAETEVFTFTNYNSVGVTLVAPSGQTSPVTFTDNADFAVLATSPDTCTAGSILAYGATCHFTVTFLPLGPFTSSVLYGTAITVNGYVNFASAALVPATIPLATSGAVGQVAGGTLTISPSSATWYGYFNPNGGSNSPSGNFGENLTITNGTPGTITFATNQSIVPVFNSNNNGDNSWNLTMNSYGSYVYPITYGISTYSDFGGNGPLIANCGSSISAGGTCQAVVYLQVDGSNGSSNGQNYTANFTIAGTEGSQNLSVQGTITVNLTNPSPQFILSPIALGQGQSVAAGQIAQYGLQLSPGKSANYPGAVAFSVTGLPAGATATFSPATLAANAGAQTVVLSIQTAAASASVAQPGIGGGRSFAPWLALALMPMAAIWRTRRSRAALARVLSVALLMVAGLAAATGLSGCGGNGSSSPVTHTPQSYTITVTATSGPSVESITVPLTIQ